MTTGRGHFIFGHVRQTEALIWLRDKRNICLHLAELGAGSVCLVVSHELVSRRCFSLSVMLSAAAGGSILVQGPVLMLCRSPLHSSGVGLSVLVRKMIFPFNQAARTGDPMREHNVVRAVQHILYLDGSCLL